MGKPWFRVKQYGYGAGLPCSWEGWLASAALLAAIITINALASDQGWAIPAVLIVVAAFCVIAWRKSDAPWKWRWGQD